MIEAAVEAIPEAKRPLLHVPALSHQPSAALATVEALARQAEASRVAFIGSSLGAFYATVAAERFGSRAHRDIVLQFGRFPHRNAHLGRTSTPDELEFLRTASRFGQ